MDFERFAARPDEDLDLLLGALLIARDAYPDLDLDDQVQRIDELAAPLASCGLECLTAIGQSRALASYLHTKCGFSGNTVDFYDPRNSFLNDVLDRRVGIPISLAVVYLEVAARVGVQARGVGFPGHFLVRVEGPDKAVLIDPFFGGETISGPGLDRLLASLGDTRRSSSHPKLLEPMKVRHILVRMLMNLRGIYASRADLRALLLVLDRIVELMPEAAGERRDRGLLEAKLGAPRAAMDDLRRYLVEAPFAEDADEVRGVLAQLEACEPAPPN